MSKTLFILGLLLTGLGSITVFTDLAESSDSARIVLGVLTLTAGACSAVLPWLKADQRYIANRRQLIAWERLLSEVDRVAANWSYLAAEAQALAVDELEAAYSALDTSDLKDRESEPAPAGGRTGASPVPRTEASSATSSGSV